ncbi:MAG: hypothetical protein ACREDE_01470, partial [Thermoplasmata archaeon]
IVLDAGARAVAEFRRDARRRLRVSSDLGVPLPISEDVARRLAPEGEGALSVRLTHELPVGQGFGMSAAGATATALAVAALAHRSRSEAITAAHLAELFGGGGLGGVAAIAGGGGLELRRRGGVSPFGRTAHLPLPGAVFVGTVGGPLPSPRLLRDRRILDRVDRASEGLDELLRRPGARPFFELSEQFTDRLGLAPPRLRKVLTALRSRGAWAAQAMFGRSFFAWPKDTERRDAVVAWLESAKLPAVEIAPARRGAHVLGPPSAAQRRV